jgi:hypothetical protein
MVDRGHRFAADADANTLPEEVHRPPVGRSLSEMLIAGELDAIYSPPRPRYYDPVKGPIVRLFPDIARSSAAISGRPAASRHSTS